MAATLTDILEPGQPELVATGFEFTEGPLWDPSGFLYVSDVDARVHYRVHPGNPAEKHVIRQNSGGANGATFDNDGNVVICEQDARRVVRMDKDGNLSVIADSYKGVRLNRCNDIVRKSDGALYFTDPDKKLPMGERDLGHSSIWRVEPEGWLIPLTMDMNHPNGIAFSPDESVLYVSNSRPDPHLHVYRVRENGTLTDSEVFDEMPYGPQGEADGVPDGLKVDEAGRIFSTGPGGVWVWEADGTRVGIIELPELPANLAWGDADRRTMYVTARTSVYRLRVKTPGIG